ncbi:MAG TPA: hypothetical protein VHM70_17630 [Polyangiaceae bacterium]|jgi:hypothetical protein|nr:hypothetical protein [Polyangiaceae bacterium]
MGQKRQSSDLDGRDLLPRHAAAYIPPHPIPVQPDARTMENRTIHVAPELDPRMALTQLSMQRVRDINKGRHRIVLAALLGASLAVLAYWGTLRLSEQSVSVRTTQVVEVPVIAAPVTTLVARGSSALASSPAASSGEGTRAVETPQGPASAPGTANSEALQQAASPEAPVTVVASAVQVKSVRNSHPRRPTHWRRRSSTRKRSAQDEGSNESTERATQGQESSESEQGAEEHAGSGWTQTDGHKVWLE